jgi:hypothetical protein
MAGLVMHAQVVLAYLWWQCCIGQVLNAVTRPVAIRQPTTASTAALKMAAHVWPNRKADANSGG